MLCKTVHTRPKSHSVAPTVRERETKGIKVWAWLGKGRSGFTLVHQLLDTPRLHGLRTDQTRD